MQEGGEHIENLKFLALQVLVICNWQMDRQMENHRRRNCWHTNKNDDDDSQTNKTYISIDDFQILYYQVISEGNFEILLLCVSVSIF